MNMNSKAVAESSTGDVTRAEGVIRVCLLLSIIIGVVLIVLAIVSGKGLVDAVGEVITLVALQGVFYLLVRFKKTHSDR